MWLLTGNQSSSSSPCTPIKQIGLDATSSSLIFLPSRLGHCQRQAMLFGLRPNGWRVCVVKFNSKAAVMGSVPTHLASEMKPGPGPLGNSLGRWYSTRIQGKSHVGMKNRFHWACPLFPYLWGTLHVCGVVWVVGRIHLGGWHPGSQLRFHLFLLFSMIDICPHFWRSCTWKEFEIRRKVPQRNR